MLSIKDRKAGAEAAKKFPRWKGLYYLVGEHATADHKKAASLIKADPSLVEFG